jgi:hypothetical protein
MLIGVFTGGVHLLWGSELSSFSMKEESNQNSVVIYPNPSPSIFNIKTNKVISNATVFALNGDEVLKSYNSSKFDLTEFKNGLYLVKIIFEDQSTQYSKISLLK